MATTNMNRIPVNVDHSNFSASSSSEQKKFSEEYRSSAGAGAPSTAYDMRNMQDETERIRNRMREFEEHCRRVREQAFARSQMPPPPPPPLFNDINNNNNNEFGFDQRVPLSSFDSSKIPPLTSSMHRSFIEDTPNGGKKYRLEFDIGDFNQNELNISTNGKTLIVKGDRELKAGSATETKTFNRELTLPDYVDINSMNAFLLDNVPAGNKSSASFKSSQTQLVTQSSVNNVLVIEAPIIMDKYSYRRSAYDKSQSPIRIGTSSNTHQSPSSNNRQTTYTTKTTVSPSSTLNGGPRTTTESHKTESKSSSSSTTHTKVVRSSSGSNLLNDEYVKTSSSYQQPQPISRVNFTTSQSNLNQSMAPELMTGYPMYDNDERCVVYKFDLSGFDNSEIHLTITADRVLEIKACKETYDQLGKIYREFKREIHLEPEVDDKLIKNILHDGILTLKIPKATRPDGLGSASNTHNINAPNGFKEIYTDDGKLSKLTGDFRGFNPENVKIVLSANNVIKVTAQQSESSPQKGSIQKECTRHYTLPAWIQPENMKAIMSRDGILTIDFNSKASPSSAGGDRINIS